MFAPHLLETSPSWNLAPPSGARLVTLSWVKAWALPIEAAKPTARKATTDERIGQDPHQNKIPKTTLSRPDAADQGPRQSVPSAVRSEPRARNRRRPNRRCRRPACGDRLRSAAACPRRGSTG